MMKDTLKLGLFTLLSITLMLFFAAVTGNDLVSKFAFTDPRCSRRNHLQGIRVGVLSRMRLWN